MLNRSQYVIQETLKSRITLTETYSVKDVNGYLLGYVKNRKLKSNFWFEGADGTHLGEVRCFSRRKLWVDRYEVYDAQNRLLATIRSAKSKGWTSDWWINDPQDQQLAKGKQPSKFLDKYQILTPDGRVLAKIYRKGDLLLRNSYKIAIKRQRLDPLLIISYAHIMMKSSGL